MYVASTFAFQAISTIFTFEMTRPPKYFTSLDSGDIGGFPCADALVSATARSAPFMRPCYARLEASVENLVDEEHDLDAHEDRDGELEDVVAALLREVHEDLEVVLHHAELQIER